jgi:hypothetical protein
VSVKSGSAHSDPVDLLIETGGGFTDATEGLISLLGNVVSDLRVIVAGAAKSNGTLLCLAAKTIVMGASSELGPIEPLVNGIPCTILIRPEIATQNFSLHMFGTYALQQSKTLARALLTRGMLKDKNSAEIDDVVHKLSSREVYFSHGSVINHVEARALGLNVEYLPPDNSLWQQLWLLTCMYDFDCRKENYQKVFEGRSASSAVAAAPKTPGTP